MALQSIRRLAVLALLALAACTSVTSQRLFIWGTDFTVTPGLAYGDDPRQKLDIYTPKAGRPKATVVFIYGGSWTMGDRGLYRFLGQALASRGYQTVVADYRLYPQVSYPGFVEDNARAFAWTKAHIAQYGGSPDRLFLMGHSAGAYNVAMLALEPKFLAAYGLKPKDALAVLVLAGPTSFNPLKTDSTKDIFAPAAGDIDKARPVMLARDGAGAGAPPFLLLHGKADTTVDPWNSERLSEALNGHGGQAVLKEYDGVSHIGVISCFAWPLRWKAPCLADTTAFLDAHLPGS